MKLMTTTTTLRVDEVFPQNNTRKTFDEDHIAGLAASIDELGLISPINVRPRPEGGHWLIAGECRWRAHQLLGKETIVAIVTDDGDRNARARMIAENAARNDINPLDEAKAYQEQVADFGDSIEAVATMAGRSTGYVQARIDLLSLIPEVHDALRSKNFLTGYAEAMVGLDPDRQRAAMVTLARSELTVVEYFDLCERLRVEQNEVSMFDADAFSLVADEWVAEAREANVHLHPRQMAQLFDRVLAGFDRAGVEMDDEQAELVGRARRAIDFRLKRGEFAPGAKRKDADA